MSIKITKFLLPFEDQKTHGLFFYHEEKSPDSSSLAVFTHGYTSHKGSILSWASRLCEEGLPVVLFDLPGHFLGNYSEVHNFETFTQKAEGLFKESVDYVFKHESMQDKKPSETNLVLGGHSLGSLLSLRASRDNFYNQFQKLHMVCVGFGLPPKGVTHIFNSAFYKSTLNLRAELISKAIGPELMFPWINEQKQEMDLTQKSVYLLTGQDDLVVGKNGAEEMRDLLLEHQNEVTLEKPTKLSHHLPELAASHIKKHLKDLGFFSAKS